MKSGKEIHRNREDDGGVLFNTNFGQSLQIAKLKCYRLDRDNGGRIRQHSGCLKFSLRMNDLGALFALSLGLASHRALHIFRQIHAFDLDE